MRVFLSLGSLRRAHREGRGIPRPYTTIGNTSLAPFFPFTAHYSLLLTGAPHYAPMKSPATTPLVPLATHTLPWFALLAIAVGAAPFAVDGESLTRPTLATAALVGLGVEAAVTRLVPVFKRQAGVRVLLDIIALLLFAALISAATGALESHLLALFLLPLTAAAIVLSRLGFLLTALFVLALYVLLGALTPHIDLQSSAFVIRLIGSLAPALIATGAISLLMSHMQVAEQQIRDLSSSDALTGLYNLRAFEQVLASTHQKAERSGRAYSVAVIDVDNLAQINESHGHDAGNQILISVADALRRSVRSVDIAARLGGNELVALLVDADAETALTVAQRIRNNVYAGTISIANRLLRANVSIGVASFPKDQLIPKELLSQAAARMQKDRTLRRPVEKSLNPSL
jgi:diguanylate cyclase (GGDEF)-like protein